jgi:hypothetical protein
MTGQECKTTKASIWGKFPVPAKESLLSWQDSRLLLSSFLRTTSHVVDVYAQLEIQEWCLAC